MNGRFLGTIRSASFKWIADTCKKNKSTYYDWHIREKLVQKIITHECILFVIDMMMMMKLVFLLISNVCQSAKFLKRLYFFREMKCMLVRDLDHVYKYFEIHSKLFLFWVLNICFINSVILDGDLSSIK